MAKGDNIIIQEVEELENHDDLSKKDPSDEENLIAQLKEESAPILNLARRLIPLFDTIPNSLILDYFDPNTFAEHDEADKKDLGIANETRPVDSQLVHTPIRQASTFQIFDSNMPLFERVEGADKAGTSRHQARSMLYREFQEKILPEKRINEPTDKKAQYQQLHVLSQLCSGIQSFENTFFDAAAKVKEYPNDTVHFDIMSNNFNSIPIYFNECDEYLKTLDKNNTFRKECSPILQEAKNLLEDRSRYYKKLELFQSSEKLENNFYEQNSEAETFKNKIIDVLSETSLSIHLWLFDTVSNTDEHNYVIIQIRREIQRSHDLDEETRKNINKVFNQESVKLLPKELINKVLGTEDSEHNIVYTGQKGEENIPLLGGFPSRETALANLINRFKEGELSAARFEAGLIRFHKQYAPSLKNPFTWGDLGNHKALGQLITHVSQVNREYKQLENRVNNKFVEFVKSEQYQLENKFKDIQIKLNIAIKNAPSALRYWLGWVTASEKTSYELKQLYANHVKQAEKDLDSNFTEDQKTTILNQLVTNEVEFERLSADVSRLKV